MLLLKDLEHLARTAWAASPPALLLWIGKNLLKQRGDAEQVVAWTGDLVEDCEYMQGFRAEHGWSPHHAHTLLVRNGGKQPIRNVSIGIPGVDGSIENGTGYVNYSVGDVPPDTTRTVPLPCDLHHHEANLVMLELFFTLHGKRWKRRADQRLRRDRDWPGKLWRARPWFSRRAGAPELADSEAEEGSAGLAG